MQAVARYGREGAGRCGIRGVYTVGVQSFIHQALPAPMGFFGGSNMTIQVSSRLGLALGAAVLLALGGCAVAPIDAYQVGAPVAYPGAVYGNPYGVAPAYPVYPAPYYAAPSVSLGVFGGWSNDRDRWRDRDHDRWQRPGWNNPPPPPRPGWNGGQPPRPGWNGGPWTRPSPPPAVRSGPGMPRPDFPGGNGSGRPPGFGGRGGMVDGG